MMGHHDRSEALFCYFHLEDQVPETHLLRLIDKHISFEFVLEQLKDSYSENGRPSVDPELLLRILLASPSNANWWRNCACIWRSAGLPAWAPRIPFRSAAGQNLVQTGCVEEIFNDSSPRA